MIWTSLDTWIVIIAALSAVSCALLGNFMVLRRMSMMGDAISHAVLPGLAIAFMATGSVSNWAMFVGAAAVGVLTAVLVQWIHQLGRVEQSASMGVVFTVLFALGLILIERAARNVHLDADCVLYGAIELTPLHTVALGGFGLPQAALTLGVVLAVNALFIVLLYKELKISTFDPELATTLGVNATLMHYLLMGLVAVTVVASFEAVGSILVIAMLIVPAAAAHLLTDRLAVMIAISAVIAVVSAVGGHLGAITAPGWFGFVEPGTGASVSTTTSGMMATVAGLIFAAALLGAPRHGLIARAVHQARLSLRVAREDVLGLLYRLEETAAVRPDAPSKAPELLRQLLHVGPALRRTALLQLTRRRLMERSEGTYRLTDAGRSRARRLIRSHRLWETFLHRYLDLPADHVHPTAERLEHVTDPEMRGELADTTDRPQTDPHGHRIPPENGHGE